MRMTVAIVGLLMDSDNPFKVSYDLDTMRIHFYTIDSNVIK